MRPKNIKRNQNVDKATSTLQMSVNRIKKITQNYQLALVKRKKVARLNSEFMEKLKADGRVTREELQEFFTSSKNNNNEKLVINS